MIPLASGIAVHCAHTKIAPCRSLSPHPDNAKKHPVPQLDRYERVGTGNGWRRSIVVSSLSGHIVKGHGAWEMAMRRGWDVPIEVQTYGSLDEERRDMLADNRLAELAETDDTLLAKLLAAIDATSLSLTGFDDADLQQLLDKLHGTAENDLQPLEIREPPKMTWALIGIPLIRYAEIDPTIRALARIPDILIETTANDDTGPLSDPPDSASSASAAPDADQDR